MRPYLLLSLLLLPAPRLAAQDACASLAKLFTKAPTVGEWAELQTQKKEGEKPTLMRMGVVGKERDGGKTLYRIQMTTTDPRSGQRMILQMLTPWGMEAVGGSQQKEVVIKMGDQPAMKMTPGKGTPGEDAVDLRKQCAKYKFVGEESVTVPAGKYRTDHYTGPDGEAWVALGVPAWHLVKMTNEDGSTMVLTAVGSGAKSEITETPVDFKTMMKNPEAMRRMMEGGHKAQTDSVAR